MSIPQKTYRLYCFDAGRRIISADWLPGDDDADAITRAQALGFGSKGEIWDGSRLVTKLEAHCLQA